MKKEFNLKGINQLTLYAIETAKKNVGDAVMLFIEEEVEKAAKTKLAFETVVDLGLALQTAKDAQGIQLNQEQMLEIESKVVNDLEIAEFKVTHEESKGNRSLRISWKI